MSIATPARPGQYPSSTEDNGRMWNMTRAEAAGLAAVVLMAAALVLALVNDRGPGEVAVYAVLVGLFAGANGALAWERRRA